MPSMKGFSTNYNQNLRHAPMRLRTQSDLLDLIGIAFFSHFLMASFTSFFKLGFYRINYFSSAKLLTRMFDLFPLVFLTCFFSYFLISLYMTNGRTISNYIFNLYSVPKNEREFSFRTCFLRASAYTIPIGLFGINPLLGALSYFIFYKPLKFLNLQSPLIDIISDCHVYEFQDEDIINSYNEDLQSEVILLAQDSSHVIELPMNAVEAEVIEFPLQSSTQDESEEDSEQAA
jgi:hypothetical protein